MKTFHYPMGHVACKTLTVSEMMAVLSGYPDDMPMMANWEGVFTPFHPVRFSVRPIDKGRPEEACWCLCINVEHL